MCRIANLCFMQVNKIPSFPILHFVELHSALVPFG